MSRKNIAVAAATLAVVVAAGGLALVLMGEQKPATGPMQQLSPDGSSSDPVESPGGSSADQSSEMTTGAKVSDAKSGVVSDQDAYEVVDALRVAGIEPVMGSDLSFEWLGGTTDSVRVTGEFEGSGKGAYTLNRIDGLWVVQE